MSNSYFQFKQFRIEQDNCGMKVTTDGCLFGGLIETKGAKRILDIGTGTGLLALMIAQRSSMAKITGLEIDKNAYKQAQLNCQNSPWSKHINVRHTSLQNYQSDHTFDLIVSNPPFFKNHFKGTSSPKNKALHNDTLSFSELAKQSASLLSPPGSLWVMYPEHEMKLFILEAAKSYLFPQRVYRIYNSTGKSIFRCIVSFGFKKMDSERSENIVIKDLKGNYTGQFTELLKNYYLHL